MYKKLIAMIMACTMLVSISPAVAAEAVPAKPTVEEILNEYHQKAFEAQNTQEISTATASAYSRSTSSSDQTLEQEAVEQLAAAGYEAYNVTAENYLALESSLKCVFAELGLDPDGSYIIVVSGEDKGSGDHNSNSRTSGRSLVDPNPSLIGGGTGEGFTYNYQGVPYTMRYITITAATGSNMLVDSTYSLAPSTWLADGAMDIFSTFLYTAADLLGDKLPLGTIASLLFDWTQEDNYTELEPGTLTLLANTTWTCDILQIWNDSYSRWDSVQGSAYAISQARCSGFIYDPEINESVLYDGILYSVKNFSPNYSDYSQRKEDAVIAYKNGRKSYDCTGDIDFFLGNEKGEIVYSSSDSPLFTHLEGWSF